MLKELEATLAANCQLVPALPIVVGVSGGPDSLCLLDILRRAGYPLVIAHFDHRLRPESSEEAAAVEALAKRMKIQFAGGSADVRAVAEQRGESVEESARRLRYAFLFEEARRGSAQAVAVAHHADDQVETVLMHFIRGAGLDGLKGMMHRTVLPAFDRSIPVVRPLLDVWRAEIVAYCETHGLKPHYDPSNASLDYTRNRVRNALIPELETYNPKIREAVWRAAHTLREDASLLELQEDDGWNASVVSRDAAKVTFSDSALRNYPIALRRRLVRRAIELLNPAADAGYATLQRASEMLEDPSLKQIDLIAGLKLIREAECLYVTAAGAELPNAHWPQMRPGQDEMRITIPADVSLANGWRLLATESSKLEHHNGDPLEVWLDADAVPAAMALRVRRQGDRFEPLGMDGHTQKLSDFFVNEKLPQRARVRWPLLCAGETVIWIPGFRPAHAFRITETTKRAVHFVMMRPIVDDN